MAGATTLPAGPGKRSQAVALRALATQVEAVLMPRQNWPRTASESPGTREPEAGAVVGASKKRLTSPSVRMTTDSTAQNEKTAEQPALVWVRATLTDVADFDFEAPIRGTKCAEVGELGDIFLQAARDAEVKGDDRGHRVFAMLTGVAGMHFRPHEPNAPYGPMLVMGDGRRSAAPEDFRGAPLDVLAYMAERATDPALRARLSDVCWLLDRKRYQLGREAVAAFVEVLQRVIAGDLSFRSNDGKKGLSYSASNLLRRTLYIATALGNGGESVVASRKLAAELRDQAVSERSKSALRRLSTLVLDFEIVGPDVVARDIESIVHELEQSTGDRDCTDLWRLAARAYHLAKKPDDEHRCRVAASDCLVEQADLMGDSAFAAAHWLSAAISELRGVPNQQEKRRKLRHRLIDVQAGVPDEMSVFAAEPIDIRAPVEQMRKAFEPLGLAASLFTFASLARSPDPQEVAEAAAKQVRDHPLASIFEASHLDDEGKVVHRAGGSDLSGGLDDPAVAQQASQNESIRRNLVVSASIETARLVITTKYHIADDTFRPLFEASPFVPTDLAGTFARGFTRFFQGDFTSAVYILVPLLENSLRYVLRQHGLDVSTFDDASQTQQDRSIVSLFDQMRTDLDRIFSRAITGDIENVFIKRPGPTLRHAVAHGLLHDGGPYGADAIYGCWLIYRLCLLPLFEHQEAIASAIAEA